MNPPLTGASRTSTSCWAPSAASSSAVSVPMVEWMATTVPAAADVRAHGHAARPPAAPRPVAHLNHPPLGRSATPVAPPPPARAPPGAARGAGGAPPGRGAPPRAPARPPPRRGPPGGEAARPPEVPPRGPPPQDLLVQGQGVRPPADRGRAARLERPAA